MWKPIKRLINEFVELKHIYKESYLKEPHEIRNLTKQETPGLESNEEIESKE